MIVDLQNIEIQCILFRDRTNVVFIVFVRNSEQF